jgi:hypothetical protein
MATIAEQLAAAGITDTLAAARTEEEWPIMGWAASRGTFGSGSLGWKPPGYTKKEPTGSQGGAIYKVAKQSANAFVALAVANTYGLINTVGEPRTFSVWLFTPGSGVNANGYQLKLVQASSGSGAPHKYKFQLSKYVEGTQTLFEETGEVTIETEGAFALAMRGGKLSMWRRETAASEWVQVGGEFTDSAFTEGYSAIDGDGSNPVLNNFKTGALTAAGETVRQFSASPASEVLTALGTVPKGAQTLVSIVKYEGTGNLLKVAKPAGEDPFGPSLAINGGAILGFEGACSPSLKVPTGTWCLVAVTKAAGTVKPRQHLFDFTTQTWTHRDQESAKGEGSEAEWEKWRHGGMLHAIGPYKGAIAASAWFNKALTDEQVEALVAAETIGSWSALTPAPIALWEFNQASVSEALQDVLGAADQTSRVETTVLEEAPPMKYGSLGVLVGKFVKVLVGGVTKSAKRWTLIGGLLKSR